MISAGLIKEKPHEVWIGVEHPGDLQVYRREMMEGNLYLGNSKKGREKEIGSRDRSSIEFKGQ
jgi:sRNA-binding carbon storage regulator CsrA